VWVEARLEVPHQSLNALGSQPVSVRGRLLPGQGGRHLSLQELRAGRWYTVSTTRTSRRGNFSLRYAPGGNTERRLRVKFAGDRGNTATSTLAGSVTVYQQSVASQYDDAGATACGIHATYGVANLSLPCGTKVRFYYHGRAITAVVQDRGPYVGGREWDLNQNLAAALGFNGVDSVWTAQ
jgi:rare lipoprotein A (peptidoglycan hydrolase)